jgi:hypothetical protein
MRTLIADTQRQTRLRADDEYIVRARTTVHAGRTRHVPPTRALHAHMNTPFAAVATGTVRPMRLVASIEAVAAKSTTTGASVNDHTQ